MGIVLTILQFFGLVWLLLVVCIGVFGGRVLIQIKNPLTKNMDNLTDVTIKEDETRRR